MDDSGIPVAVLIVVATIICVIIFRKILSSGKSSLRIDELADKIKNLEENKGEDIVCILNKYYWQRRGITPISCTPKNISEKSLKRFKEYDEWRDDGKSTGIESDAIFFALQRYIFGDVIWTLKELEDKKTEQ